MSARLNLAMWSGPRNLSTALMRSFGNRADVTVVMDEPFYASYLKATNKQHPLFQEVIKSQESNWKKVIEQCVSKEGTGICYQKHMVHHLLPSFDKQWLISCLNCFLIREPKEVISSFLTKWPEAEFEDFGFGIIWSDFFDQFKIGGFKLGFWFAQQGSIYFFVILIFIYIYLMNKLDKKYKDNPDKDQ